MSVADKELTDSLLEQLDVHHAEQIEFKSQHTDHYVK